MAISPSAIVPEILKKDNYERWRILIQHHFEAQDLWNVILNTPPVNGKREWTKKNASALLAIKISCEAEVFDKIKEIKSAKEAWDTLAKMHKLPPFSHDENIAQRKEDVSDQSETVQHHKDSREIEIKENDYHVIEIEEHPAETSDDTDIENLCEAIRSGKTWTLYGLCKPALLLRQVDSEGRIPVQLAFNTGHEPTAHIVYRKTRAHCPEKSLDVVLTGKIGFHLLEECITKKMFDIAYDLLQSYPNLAEPQGFDSDFIPLILTLAQAPAPFFRGSQLIFWKRWIYNC
ncbi:hypothetical protein SLEP1_g47787 [Rubroshorea leprosula]|uniref:DUF4219 domain-containing protein n=1 Tax=Rubroshorea leprosula TaxID=152421 RepID=A0AAV5LTF0_9ROSI|nr:hypothetical protein SLEP1_g47787 [Rubroshorea leprosula]